MKITIVADVLGQENNGTTVTIKRLIEGLKARGHEVRVISPTKSDDPNYYTVEKKSFGIFNGYMDKNGVELAKPDMKLLHEAIEGADVVHIVLPFAMGKKAVQVCNELDIPFTAAFHCQPMLEMEGFLIVFFQKLQGSFPADGFHIFSSFP